MTHLEAGPQDLLKMIRCSCKKKCDKRCSCRKAGLKCSVSWSECLGAFCLNAMAEPVGPENDADCEEFSDRHFLDVFAD